MHACAWFCSQYVDRASNSLLAVLSCLVFCFPAGSSNIDLGNNFIKYILCCLIVRVISMQVYIVYLGHLPSSADASEHTEGFSAVELAHHDMLDQVLDGGRSKTLLDYCIVRIYNINWIFIMT
jgi:hypothetical protein